MPRLYETAESVNERITKMENDQIISGRYAVLMFYLFYYTLIINYYITL